MLQNPTNSLKRNLPIIVACVAGSFTLAVGGVVAYSKIKLSKTNTNQPNPLERQPTSDQANLSKK